MARPFVVMVAGPNGAGKTTLTRHISNRGIDLGLYINPDDIAATLQGSYGDRVREAQAIADQLRRESLGARASFTFETVMSHPSKVEVLREARDLGYETRLFFVGTDDPATNVERVALRVREGGHDVPPEKIVARWSRTMTLLADAIRASDVASLFDNSAPATGSDGMRLVAEHRVGRTDSAGSWRIVAPVPVWIELHALAPLRHTN